MKKGCFLTVLIGLTLLVIISYYLVKYHGEEILEMGTEQLFQIAQSKIESDLSSTENNIYADSLKVAIENYFIHLKDLDPQLQLERIEELADDFEIILMDAQIDSAEFDFVIKRLVKNEK
ncbi:MAG: hypothetical protein OQJ81_12155 [Melioribacteraceae bacterium]|nr:hypothetical protein [Melioribacteraceae bacterium]